MKSINIFCITLLIAALPFVALVANAKGNAEEGKKKSITCAACHGEGGAKPILPEYPVLAGQHEDYLVAVLNQYKSGKRQNAIMKGLAAALSPQDIRDLAAYFSKEKSDLRMKY
jgi:cytochrome c553